MRRHSILRELEPFKGRQLIDVADEMKAIAEKAGYRINPMDTEINKSEIDVEDDRIDVRIDKDSNILSFSIG
jgi:hypothetical protein